MQEKLVRQMLKNTLRLIKEVAEQFAVSFFFACFLYTIVYFNFGEQINDYLSLINMITIAEKQVEEQEISFDSVKRRLTNYPKWGSIWATLEIPSINLNVPIYHGDSLDILRYGVGHFSGSYFSGEGGSIVLAAHNSRQFFMRLPELKKDTEITIKTNYGVFKYKLIETKIIKGTDMESLPIQNDKEILMMYTCYPVNTIGHKTKRFVVYAELIEVEYEKQS